MTALAEIFLDSLAALGQADAALESTLAGMLERARQRWPSVTVPDAEFAARLGLCLAHGMARESSHGQESQTNSSFDPGALAALQSDDIYLALACARGAPGALAAFEDSYGGSIRTITARILAGSPLRDDAEQLVRDRLFVAAPDSAPKILEYHGRGTLLAFSRVVATRVALGLLRKHKNHDPLPDDGGWQLPDQGDDPELQYLRVLYRSEFKAAFVAAIGLLTARERTLLRYHLIDRLSIDKIAAIYDIHRATAARHLTRAKQAVIRETQRNLRERLRLEQDELASILRLVEGNVDVSVRRLLTDDSR